MVSRTQIIIILTVYLFGAGVLLYNINDTLNEAQQDTVGYGNVANTSTSYSNYDLYNEDINFLTSYSYWADNPEMVWLNILFFIIPLAIWLLLIVLMFLPTVNSGA